MSPQSSRCGFSSDGGMREGMDLIQPSGRDLSLLLWLKGVRFPLHSQSSLCGLPSQATQIIALKRPWSGAKASFSFFF